MKRLAVFLWLSGVGILCSSGANAEGLYVFEVQDRSIYLIDKDTCFRAKSAFVENTHRGGLYDGYVFGSFEPCGATEGIAKYYFRVDKKEACFYIREMVLPSPLVAITRYRVRAFISHCYQV